MDWVLNPPIYLQVGAGALVAWRLAVLFAYEAGPFRLILKFRERLGYDHDDDGHVVSYRDDFPVSLLSCVWCLSFWTTLVVYGILWAAPYFVVVLGTWAAATYLEAIRPRS